MRRLLLALGLAATLVAAAHLSSCGDDLRPPPVFSDGAAAEASVDAGGDTGGDTAPADGGGE